MAKYKVLWKYASSYGGAWKKGEIVDIDPALAKIINVDSPGVLEAVKETKPAEKPEPEAPEVEERAQPPAQDRQLKAAPAKRKGK